MNKMRMGKKGQLFSFILVVITLLMCIFSFWVYSVQQKQVQSSLVSPLVVLEVRDNLSIFELREDKLILDSLNAVTSDFGSDEFLQDFKKEFISGISEEMKNFIFSDLTWNGDVVKSRNVTFLENIVYSGEPKYVGSSGMKFVRGEIGKSMELKALKVQDVNFVVDFDFDFSAEYSIKKVGNNFKVEKI
jgi:hypothetical protein